MTQNKAENKEELIQRLTEENQKLAAQQFFDAGLVRFTQVMRWSTDSSFEEWGNRFLEEFTPFVNALSSTLYVAHNRAKVLKRIGVHNSTVIDLVDEEIPFGEGTIGQVANSKKEKIFQNINSAFSFHSGTTSIELKAILTWPIMFNDHLCGVLELYFHMDISEKTKGFLERISPHLASNIDSIKKEIELKEKHQEVENKNELIHQSLLYAQRIQKSILPSSQRILETFSDYLVLFRPKDIVSGDFYWMGKNGDLTFVVVADCTGHGVPGAFMSMIGNSALYQIINEKKIVDPSQILEELHQIVFNTLQQKNQIFGDGMDVCCCVVEELYDGTFEVCFSGAKRPLYYVSEGKVNVEKGTRRSIGGVQKKKRDFEEHCFSLQKGDMLFLTTDGYMDQNNRKRKAMGSRKLLNILEVNIGEDCERINQDLVDELEFHQQDEIQRDDITILGLKL